MAEHPRLRGEHQHLLTRAQLAALGVTSLSLCTLTFLLGMQVARLRAPEVEPMVETPALIRADVESESLAELLAMVEQASAAELPELKAARLSFPKRLAGDALPMEVPAAPEADAQALTVEPALGVRPEAPIDGDGELPEQGWAVQLWSFQDAAAADEKLALLDSLGHEGYRVAALVSGETWYRVRVGPFDTKDKALAAMPALAAATEVEDPIVTPVR